MKAIVLKLKTAVFFAFLAWNVDSLAQVPIIYVVKSDTIVFSSLVSDFDNIAFDGAKSGEILIVHKKDGSPADTTLLNEIRQISFSKVNMSIERQSGNKVYTLSEVVKFMFKDNGSTGIHNLSAQNVDVLVRVTPRGDVIVESPVAINSLTLYSADGKMISQQYCEKVETQCVISLRNAAVGIYLLHVETEQGVVVKKIVKPLNK